MDGALSSPEASFCPREAGERERRKRAGDDGKGKERKRGLFALPIGSPRAFKFSIIAIFIWLPSGSHCEGESGRGLKETKIRLKSRH